VRSALHAQSLILKPCKSKVVALGENWILAAKGRWCNLYAAADVRMAFI
jgi:hypothetical protein